MSARARSRFLGAVALVSLLSAAAAVAEPDETIAVRTPESDPELATAIRGSWFFRWLAPGLERLRVDVGPEADGEREIVVTRLPAAPALRRRLAGLPVELLDDGIVFDTTAYRRAGHVLAVRIPGEPHSSWMVAGRDPERLAELVATVLVTSSRVARSRVRPVETFDYLLRETRYLERRGFWRALDAESGTVTIDPFRELDRMAERDRAWAELAPIPGRHLLLRVPPESRSDPRLAALARELDRAAREMVAAIPLRLERPIELVVERDFERLGRAFGEVAEAILPPPGLAAAGDLHLVFHPDDLDAYRFGLARALVLRAGLEPPPWIADGAALWLSRGWYGRPYDAYLADFAAARVLPSAAQLLAAERPADGSRVIWPAVAAAVVAELGGDTLRQKLASTPSRARVAATLARLGRPEAPMPPLRSPRRAAIRNGVSLAMSPGIEHAYHGAAVDLQLERFAGLGADAVAIMPYAFQRAPDDPAIRYIQGDPGDENDAGLVHAARRARAHRFAVLWKPHIYVGGSWPGEVEMTSATDWEAWWSSYRRYVVHQAVLARFAQADEFAVGVELGRTVSQETAWRAVIAAVRRLFPGRLTYAANWWGDFDRVEFWDALDLIGVDAYFPLATDAGADREALSEGARTAVGQLADASRRHDRPVLLTELGFAARAGAWVAPHEEGGIYDEADQRLAYEVFFEALGRPSWLAGVFLWKAFSHPHVDAAGEAPDFRFMGRAAEAAISAYFRSDTAARDSPRPAPPEP